MADLLTTFNQPPGGAIATYNFFDIQEGTAITTFYPSKVATGPSAYAYIATTNTEVYSETDGFTDANGMNIDIDITFNLPKILKGVMYMNIPVNVKATSGTEDVAITGTIIHYDGSTETTIGAATTTPDTSTSTSNASKMRIIKWNLTEKHFRAGETLRITLTGVVDGTGSGSGNIGHSPVGTQNAGSGTLFESLGTSRLTLFVPFKLDIGS